MVAWVQVVQSHPDYSVNLQLYLDGEIEDVGFIDSVSDMIDSRENERVEMRANFKWAVEAVGIIPHQTTYSRFSLVRKFASRWRCDGEFSPFDE